MRKLWSMLAVLVTLLVGCASGGPKTMFIDGTTSPEKAAIVHPTTVPGGLMLIRKANGKSAYTASIGYAGSIYLPPGDHTLEVEVSHGFKVQDAGGPAWTAPKGATVAAVVGEAGSGLLVVKGAANLRVSVDAGKTYEVKFGFDRSSPDKPVPVIWLSSTSGV